MKRPWNIGDHPVYSLATCHRDELNMNICTYVTAVSLTPKIFAVAIELGSKTEALMRRSSISVLQSLAPTHIPLIKLLGRTSGHEIDKGETLRRKKKLTSWKNYSVLDGIAAAVELEKMDHLQTGDHQLFICRALRAHTFHPDVLMLSHLRERKLIRN